MEKEVGKEGSFSLGNWVGDKLVSFSSSLLLGNWGGMDRLRTTTTGGVGVIPVLVLVPLDDVNEQ
eukprot:CAMPEP_0170827024 /NCGR_PEP_ID=MMETSP0733-20121128/46991_1 /TAXON_ID=186038 /ORGANISM="Fragilariopsis kerguelensis, Strain L26-C5" /LENGTH=64 /DNA_ID=CAMNT_0011191061 /DNA_START=1 /DNA_END=195 /DNA_ORIENTATION=-